MDYLKGITHCTFAAKDYPAMQKFYGETLGMKAMFHLPYTQDTVDLFKGPFGYTEMEQKAGDEWITYYQVSEHQFIELFNTTYTGENDNINEGFAHVCLLVEDIVEAARDLEAKGIQLWNGPKRINNPIVGPYPENPIEAGIQGQCGSLAFYIQDPEGNELEIMQYTDDSLQLKTNKGIINTYDVNRKN